MIQLKTNYRVDSVYYTSTVDTIKLEKYLSSRKINNFDELLEEIYEFFWTEDHIDIINPEHTTIFSELLEIELDEKEVIKDFNKFISPITCCEKAPLLANYCPTCGKKLKND